MGSGLGPGFWLEWKGGLRTRCKVQGPPCSDLPSVASLGLVSATLGLQDHVQGRAAHTRGSQRMPEAGRKSSWGRKCTNHHRPYLRERVCKTT